MGIKPKLGKSEYLFKRPEGRIENPEVARILAVHTENSRQYLEIQAKIADKSGNSEATERWRQSVGKVTKEAPTNYEIRGAEFQVRLNALKPRELNENDREEVNRLDYFLRYAWYSPLDSAIKDVDAYYRELVGEFDSGISALEQRYQK